MAGLNASVLQNHSFLDRGHRSSRSVTSSRAATRMDDGQGFWGHSSGHHTLVQVGASKPVFVESAIARESARGRSVHICMFDDWAWFVSDRTIMLWKHKPSSTNGPVMDKFSYYELKLPPTGLVHRVDLVDVFLAGDATIPSCMAVTPEGKVVLWPNITCGHLSIELNLELSGQECEALKPMWPTAALLTTTSGTVVFLMPKNVTSLAGIDHRPLRAAEGLFLGMRRRLGAMIFGGGLEGKVQKMVRVASRPYRQDPSVVTMYVLVGTSLRKWRTNPVPDGYDEMLFECDLDMMVRTAYSRLFDLPPNDVCTWILDMEAGKDGVTVLVGGSRLGVDADVIHLAVGFIDVDDGEVAPTHFSTFSLIPRREAVTTNFESALACYKLLLSGSDLVVYHPNFLYCVSLNDPMGIQRTVLETGVDSLLGYGLTGPPSDPSTTFYFYSENAQSLKMLRNYHVMVEAVAEKRAEKGAAMDTSVFGGSQKTERSVRRNRAVAESTMNDSLVSEVPSELECSGVLWNSTFNGTRTASRRAGGRFTKNMKSIPANLLASMRASDDAAIKLKAAVILYARGEEVAARDIVSEMLPQAGCGYWSGALDAVVDQIVLRCSTENILDDIPAQDPRWQRVHPGSGVGGVSSSMLVANQIRDKQKVHETFLEFLDATKLLKTLATVTCGQRVIATTHRLAEDAEKLIAAGVVYERRKTLGNLFDDIIGTLVVEHEDFPRGSIAKLDLFFRKISNIGIFFTDGLRKWQERASDPGANETSLSQMAPVSELISSCLNAILGYRRSMTDDLYLTPDDGDFSWEFLPWTSLPEFREFLVNQIELCVMRGACDVKKVEMYVRLDECLKVMIDFLLDGYRAQVETIPRGARRKALVEEYARVRHKYLSLLASKKGSESFAVEKAELYRDYDVLCEITFRGEDKEERERFQEAGLKHIDAFPDYDFAEHAFNWLLARGLGGDAINWALKTRTLDAQLKKRPSLYWLYLLRTKRIRRAAHVTFLMAQKEETLARRKKDLLEITFLLLMGVKKSSGLHEKERAILAEVLREMKISDIHQRIPDHAFEAAGHVKPFDKGGSPLKAAELIQLCVLSLNTHLNAGMLMDAFRASTLLDEKEDGRHLRRYIWGAAFKRNDWKTAMEEPRAIRQTFLFKVAEELFASSSFPDHFRISCYESMVQMVSVGDLPEVRDEQVQYNLKVAFEMIASEFGIHPEEDSMEDVPLGT